MIMMINCWPCTASAGWAPTASPPSSLSCSSWTFFSIFFSVIVFPTTPEVELLDTAKVLDSGHFPDEVAGEVENLQLRQLLQTGDGADPEV